MDLLTSLLPMIAIFAIFYLLLIRPQQRKLREQQERINSLQVGARVMTASGIYGTVRHLGTAQAVLEVAPGIEMTIAKQAITQVVKPEDEEFEYEDDDGDLELPEREPSPLDLTPEQAAADEARDDLSGPQSATDK